jgi:hypothetical protein
MRQQYRGRLAFMHEANDAACIQTMATESKKPAVGGLRTFAAFCYEAA